MNFSKYPYLNEQWVIRGSSEIPRLYNIYTNKVIKLNKQVLEYIVACDGKMSFAEIQEYFSVSTEAVKKFYSQFLSEGILELSNDSINVPVDIAMCKKEPWLKEVHIDITSNCNLRCRHCFWGENLNFDKNEPAEKWFNVIENLKENGVGRVVLSGGEALTNLDLLKIVKKCNEKKIMVASIFTNGTIFNKYTEEIVSYISSEKLTTTFYISLDGYTPQQHDFIRGEGRFRQTISFIEFLIENRSATNANYKILINSLIHKENYQNLIEWYVYLKNLGVDGWRFTTGRVSGFLKKNADAIKINTHECFGQYLQLIEYILQKYKKGEELLYVNIENFFNGRMLETKKAYIFNEDLCICDYKSQACSIDPHGNVQFCTGWQNIKYGNVFKKSIADIWYSEELREIKEFKIKDITQCQSCKYLKYCGGGCRLECEDIYSKDIAICESFELFEKYIVPILKTNGIEFTV